MINYIGYGFDTRQITAAQWLAFAKKYLPDIYAGIIDELGDPAAVSEIEQDNMADAVSDAIECVCGSYLSDIMRDVINQNEKQQAGTDYIVSAYDHYVVFDSCRFADDSARTKYIRSQEDLIQMIARYIDVTNITFGNLYEGNEWTDSNYSLD